VVVLLLVYTALLTSYTNQETDFQKNKKMKSFGNEMRDWLMVVSFSWWVSFFINIF